MERAFKGIWIPKEVWLDENLSWIEKFLLVEIDSLDNEKGCWANNEYFAKFFGVSKDRISRLISSLNKKGYITVEFLYKDGTKAIEKRIVRITNTYRCKQLEGIGENTNRGIGENTKDNNTSINNTINNTKEYIRELPTSKKPKSKPVRHKYGEYKNVLLSDDQMEKLKSEFPHDWEQRIDRVSEYCEVTGKTYKNYLATIRAWAKKDKQPNNKAVRKQQTFTRQEKLPEWATEPVNYSTNKPKVTEEDRRRFLNVSDREEGF
ncbi:helix-turn-helix domain-containing protein [Enterococcus casseliflavus]|uniref:helix-turn-helix domain-containing protein n=1 Tax=Enterococcus casseliflavus TaxID=37734 RepID=UPI00232FA6D6|nr:helix-turn-helix domain-containing protein [Enterococcus casseliflavus]MDB1690071.1 helix-turn-helix domain-containing protein [Enterococcus casseliflavus]